LPARSLSYIYIHCVFSKRKHNPRRREVGRRHGARTLPAGKTERKHAKRCNNNGKQVPQPKHSLSNEALADEIGRVDAIAKAAEAELKALKDEFKARGLDCAEGVISTVTAAEVFKHTLDTARVREALGDHVKQFETLMVSTVIRIKPTRRLEVLAAA
jgi:hypothetical protein